MAFRTILRDKRQMVDKLKKRKECITCEAVFEVSHELDPQYYNIEFCPFCGNELEDEETFEFLDPFEEEFNQNG